MYVLVWKFRVQPGAEQAFQTGYGAGGQWARLFAEAGGFLSTELARSVVDDRTFFTIDSWESKAAFEIFLDEFASEYSAIDTQFEELTESEHFLGAIEME